MKGGLVAALVAIAAMLVSVSTAYSQAKSVDTAYLANGSVVRSLVGDQAPKGSLESEYATATRAGNSAAAPLASTYIVLDPLGFLEMGPMIDLEFRVSPRLYALAHVRFHGMGLLSHLIVDDNVSLLSTAAGGGLRYLFENSVTPNAPYVGGIGELTWVGYSGDLGTSWEYKGNSITATVLANFGYQWVLGGLIIDVGAYVGAAQMLSSKWAYTSDPSVMHSDDLLTYFAGMASVSFGWALK